MAFVGSILVYLSESFVLEPNRMHAKNNGQVINKIFTLFPMLDFISPFADYY